MINSRLKPIRMQAKLSQERLGVLAGLDETTARSRISQYETGTYRPTFEMVCAIAAILDVPECYFYIVDDDFAEEVLQLYRSKKGQK